MPSFLVWQKITEGQGVFLRKEIISVPAGDSCLLKMVKKVYPDDRKRGFVLLLHGFAQSRYRWHLRGRNFVNCLAYDGDDIFNFDMRGHGRSSMCSGSPRFFEDYVNYDLPAAVEKALEISGDKEKFFLIGHSLGGAIVYTSAPLFPDKLGVVITKVGFDKTRIEVLKLMKRWAASGELTDTSGERDCSESFLSLDTPILLITGDKDTLCTHIGAHPAYLFSSSRDKEYRISSYKDDKAHWGHIDLIMGDRIPVYVWYIFKWMMER